MRHSSAVLLSVLIASPAAGQGQPSCLDYLAGFRSKIEANYAGYLLEVKGERRSAFEREFANLQTRARSTPTDRCFPILRAFTEWFDDPHLFVFQDTRLDSATAAGNRRAIPRLTIDEAALRDDLRRRARALDPVEGIWSDGALRVGITRAGNGRFNAVVLTPDSSSWSVGDVRGVLTRTSRGYEADWASRNYARRVLSGGVRKRVLLRLSPEMLAKEFPVEPQDAGLIDPGDPRRPTLSRREGTVIISMTSHSPAYMGTLDSLIARNAEALRSADRLIVDLRGNEGGSSFTSNGLLPYIMTADQLPERFPERGGAVMLSSPDQIAYAKRSFGPETTAFVRGLVSRMQAGPGKLVPFLEPGQQRPADRADSVITGPKRVGILVDRETVSAAEVLVLQALRSKRATVFGEPTTGALDYQSTSIVRVIPGAGRWFLGYPTITRDTMLPLDGMRGKGIPPQVPVSWSSVADPVTFVDQYLRRRP